MKLSAQDERLLEQLKTAAAGIELKAVDFLDKSGRIAGNRERYVMIRMTFHDGVTIMLPRRLEEHFKKTTFSLRPSRDNA